MSDTNISATDRALMDCPYGPLLIAVMPPFVTGIARAYQDMSDDSVVEGVDPLTHDKALT